MTGGAELGTVQLLAALSNRCEIHLISLFDAADRPLELQAEAAGITVHYLGKRCGIDPRVAFRIAQVINTVKPDIIHTHLYSMSYSIPTLLRSRSGAWFHTIHSVASFDAQGIEYYLNRIAFRAGVHLIAISGRLRGDVENTYRRARVAVIPNGIRVGKFKRSETERARLRAEWRLDAGQVVFTSVSSLSPVKNHADLLKAFVAVSQCHSKARLLIVGDGILRSELGSTCNALGLEGVVKFLGQREDVSSILSASDVFVNSSLVEGNPQSVMEAMAASLPIIAPRIGGIPDLVSNNVNGLLISPRHICELSEAMRRLVEDREARNAMGTSNAVKAMRAFDVSLMADRYWRLYCAANLKCDGGVIGEKSG
jgi:glycosyltransferase involved in cell wall biosynthesis